MRSTRSAEEVAFSEVILTVEAIKKLLDFLWEAVKLALLLVSFLLYVLPEAWVAINFADPTP